MATLKAKNKVIAGDYKGKDVKYGRKKIEISAFMRDIPLNSNTVSSYELVNKETKKDKAGALRSGLIWGAGGLIAHAVLSDGIGIYNVAIQFKDGKSCLIEIDEDAYQVLNKTCFRSGLIETEPEIHQLCTGSSGVQREDSFFCTKCGNQLPSGSNFCNVCGSKVLDHSESSSAAVHEDNSDHTQTLNSVFTFKGRNFDLEELYEKCNGKSIKMSVEINKAFSLSERSAFSSEESRSISHAVMSYCADRKKRDKK